MNTLQSIRLLEESFQNAKQRYIGIEDHIDKLQIIASTTGAHTTLQNTMRIVSPLETSGLEDVHTVLVGVLNAMNMDYSVLKTLYRNKEKQQDLNQALDILPKIKSEVGIIYKLESIIRALPDYVEEMAEFQMRGAN